MKMNLKSKALMAGAVGALMSLTAVPSHADMFAISKLTVFNFVILGSDGAPLDANTDFGELNFTSSADMEGSLTGTAGFGFNEPNGDDIDFPSSCLSTTGDCNPLPENTFPYLSAPQFQDYVAADHLQVGSPIDNLAGFDPVAGADVGQEAVGSLSTTAAAGSANVNNGLEANWTFTLEQATGITFAGDFATYLEAFASAGELNPGKASAATTFEISITDLVSGLVVYNFKPDLLNQTTSANAGGFGSDIRTCGAIAAITAGCGNGEVAGGFGDTTGLLLADNLYQLSLRSNANIDIARVVPAPGTLALLGLGLLGLSRRRRVS